MFFCFTRTFSNTLETVLTLVSLYYWPCMRPASSKHPFMSRKLGLTIAAFACAIRPTSGIIWLYVGFLELFVARDRLQFILLEVAPIGLVLIHLPCIYIYFHLLYQMLEIMKKFSYSSMLLREYLCLLLTMDIFYFFLLELKMA